VVQKTLRAGKAESVVAVRKAGKAVRAAARGDPAAAKADPRGREAAAAVVAVRAARVLRSPNHREAAPGKARAFFALIKYSIRCVAQ
jgi:hypothetical protein